MNVFPVSLQQVSPSVRTNLWTRRTRKRARRSSAAGASGELHLCIWSYPNSQISCLYWIVNQLSLAGSFRSACSVARSDAFFSLFQSEIDKVEVQVSRSVCSKLTSAPVLHVCLRVCHFTSGFGVSVWTACALDVSVCLLWCFLLWMLCLKWLHSQALHFIQLKLDVLCFEQSSDRIVCVETLNRS